MEEDELHILSDLVDILSYQYDELVKMAEPPYRKNLKLLREFDIKGNYTIGRVLAGGLLSDVDLLISELEGFRDASKAITKKADEIIR